MKKVLMPVVLFLVFSAAAVQRVQSITISPWLGAGNVYMADLTRDLRNRAGTGTVNSLVAFSTVSVVGLDIGGLRFTYVGMPNFPAVPMIPKDMKASVNWTDSSGYRYNHDLTSSLMTGMIGFRIPHPGGALLHLGMFVGYGMATLKEVRTCPTGFKPPDPFPSTITIDATGGDLVAEATMGIKIFILEVGAAYRYAKINKMLYSRSYNIDGIAGDEYVKGQPIKTTSTTPKNLVFDYSGIYITAGLRFGPGPKEPIEDTLQRFFRRQPGH